MGGAKVSDKLGVIEALLGVVDELIVGGGMCFTFLAARGANVGSSLLEEDMIETCARLLDSGAPIRLPMDITALGPGGKIGDPSVGGEVRQVGMSMPVGWMGLDIGPGSAVEFCDLIAEARTVLWNGPMGVFEDPRFAAGTQTVADAVADCRGFTVVGGGDSASAARQFGVDGPHGPCVDRWWCGTGVDRTRRSAWPSCASWPVIGWPLMGGRQRRAIGRKHG